MSRLCALLGLLCRWSGRFAHFHHSPPLLHVLLVPLQKHESVTTQESAAVWEEERKVSRSV